MQLVDQLPDEVWVHILSFIKNRKMFTWSSVSTRFNHLLNEDALLFLSMKSFFKNEFHYEIENKKYFYDKKFFKAAFSISHLWYGAAEATISYLENILNEYTEFLSQLTGSDLQKKLEDRPIEVLFLLSRAYFKLYGSIRPTDVNLLVKSLAYANLALLLSRPGRETDWKSMKESELNNRQILCFNLHSICKIYTSHDLLETIQPKIKELMPSSYQSLLKWRLLMIGRNDYIKEIQISFGNYLAIQQRLLQNPGTRTNAQNDLKKLSQVIKKHFPDIPRQTKFYQFFGDDFINYVSEKETSVLIDFLNFFEDQVFSVSYPIEYLLKLCEFKLIKEGFLKNDSDIVKIYESNPQMCFKIFEHYSLPALEFTIIKKNFNLSFSLINKLSQKLRPLFDILDEKFFTEIPEYALRVISHPSWRSILQDNINSDNQDKLILLKELNDCRLTVDHSELMALMINNGYFTFPELFSSKLSVKKYGEAFRSSFNYNYIYKFSEDTFFNKINGFLNVHKKFFGVIPFLNVLNSLYSMEEVNILKITKYIQSLQFSNPAMRIEVAGGLHYILDDIISGAPELKELQQFYAKSAKPKLMPIIMRNIKKGWISSLTIEEICQFSENALRELEVLSPEVRVKVIELLRKEDIFSPTAEKIRQMRSGTEKQSEEMDYDAMSVNLEKELSDLLKENKNLKRTLKKVEGKLSKKSKLSHSEEFNNGDPNSNGFSL